MIIEFRIPNGNMKICAEEFFAEAGMAQIRRMFKMLRESGLDDSRRKEILVWLRDQASEKHRCAEYWAERYVDCFTEYKELEVQYEHMKSPCYVEFTQDKEALKAAREKAAFAKREASASKSEYQTAKKMRERYQKIIDILVEVIKRGGDNGESN